nr:hypothetical protein [uncultured Acetatifactor sp.]
MIPLKPCHSRGHALPHGAGEYETVHPDYFREIIRNVHILPVTVLEIKASGGSGESAGGVEIICIDHHYRIEDSVAVTLPDVRRERKIRLPCLDRDHMDLQLFLSVRIPGIIGSGAVYPVIYLKTVKHKIIQKALIQRIVDGRQGLRDQQIQYIVGIYQFLLHRHALL